MKRSKSTNATAESNKKIKATSPNIIPKSEWPDKFKELENIFFRFNSFFSFISTRNHILPTFESIKPNIEKAIHRKLEFIDIARLVYLLPNDISFKYVEDTQIYHNNEKIVKLNANGEFIRKETDMFQLKDIEDNQDNQILLLEFVDGNLLKSRLNKNYINSTATSINHDFNPRSLKKLIERRNAKFAESVSQFLNENPETPFEELTKKCVVYFPKKINYIDPIELMKQNKTNENNLDLERPTISDLIHSMTHDKVYKDQVVHDGLHVIPKSEAKYGDVKFELPIDIIGALHKFQDIDRFYSHQAEALNFFFEGNHVMVTTSTSSGKSLIYQIIAAYYIYNHLKYLEISVPEYLENIPTAMYIFPTKALAQDQKRSLNELFSHVKIFNENKILAETFDGDTDKDARDHIRINSKVIFTNPDMLHANILPAFHKWRHFLRNLKVIVIDELHVYKGLFGSHVALVIRRLRRICNSLGNDDIQFISCSATLRSPIKHMQQIFGLTDDSDTIVHISEDGSPHGEKHLVLWNPPMIDRNNRESFLTETAKILITLVEKNIKTICFCTVRRTVELLMKEVRYICKERHNDERFLENQIMSYRGGYSINDRREIEQEMFNGNLKAIIATNALELGIDIGALDAVVICGFPVLISNFHQQSGRAGRRQKDSLTLFVGGSDPVNQYYMQNPNLLLGKNFQELILDFDNPLILENHLQCAAYEIPINMKGNDQFFFPVEVSQKILEKKLRIDERGYYHPSQAYLPWPAKHVSLRGIEEEMYAVIDITNNRDIVIEEIEALRTSFTLYEEGIFIHQGLPYIIREFNSFERYAKVERVNVDWVTRQRDYTDVDPSEVEKIRSQRSNSDVPVYFGKITITIYVFGFFKVDKKGKILDSIDVKNPPVVIHSKGFWIDIPMKATELITQKELNISAGIHAAQHAIINVLPMLVVAGYSDVQTECKAPEKEFAQRQTVRVRPARLIFSDSKGGAFGSGLSEKIFETIDEILKLAFDKVKNCICDFGCPECVAATYCKENSLVISKLAAIIILAVILNIDLDWAEIPDGPEENLPKIEIETIQPVGSHVKFSKDLEIIDAKKLGKPEYVIKLEGEL